MTTRSGRSFKGNTEMAEDGRENAGVSELVKLLLEDRQMRVYGVREDRWAFKLAPQLTGRAQQAYAALNADDAVKYEEVKAAILRRYDISEETYRQRFRTTKERGEASPWIGKG